MPFRRKTPKVLLKMGLYKGNSVQNMYTVVNNMLQVEQNGQL